MIKAFKPTRMVIHQSIFVNMDKKERVYTLRISNGRRISQGRNASMSFYGDRKYISEVFHQLLAEFGLPKDRLSWKQIKTGRQEWNF
jgi:hypothetical protein